MSEVHALVCSSPSHAQTIERAWREVLGAESPCDFIPVGSLCRERVDGGGIQCVLVGPGITDVTPENLVAALRKDDEKRCERNPAGIKRLTVVLALERLSGSSASRGRSAGADLIASVDELPMSLSAFLSHEGVALPAKLERPMPKARSRSLVAPAAGLGRLVGFAGARGGAGVSTIAALFAAAAVRAGISTALVDCDVRFGNVTGFISGLKKPDSDVLGFAGASVDSCGRVICAPQVPSSNGGASDAPAVFGPPGLPEHGDALIECAGDLAQRLRDQFQLAVIDLGSSWDEAMAAVLLECDLTLLVMDQRSSSVASCAKAVGLACRLGAVQARLAYVVNRCGPRCAVTELDAALALDAEQVSGVRDGGPTVEGLSSEGLLAELLEHRSPLTTDVDALLETALGRFGMERGREGLGNSSEGKRWRRRRGGAQ